MSFQSIDILPGRVFVFVLNNERRQPYKLTPNLAPRPQKGNVILSRDFVPPIRSVRLPMRKRHTRLIPINLIAMIENPGVHYAPTAEPFNHLALLTLSIVFTNNKEMQRLPSYLGVRDSVGFHVSALKLPRLDKLA